VQLAEAPAEVHVLFDGEPLIAKEDDQAIHEGIVHLLELLVP
jgi:hypothetical protein